MVEQPVVVIVAGDTQGLEAISLGVELVDVHPLSHGGRKLPGCDLGPDLGQDPERIGLLLGFSEAVRYGVIVTLRMNRKGEGLCTGPCFSAGACRNRGRQR